MLVLKHSDWLFKFLQPIRMLNNNERSINYMYLEEQGDEHSPKRLKSFL